MQSFEKSIGRLEEIVAALQSGKLSLDESLKVFQEGAGIISECNTMLDEAEQKVEVLEVKETEEF